jgi:hypothetical protein
VERQQLKWFAYASLGVVLSFVLSGVLASSFFHLDELLVDLISGIPILGWPLALGIAILRYRLYDIQSDRGRRDPGRGRPVQPLRRRPDGGGLRRPAPRRARPGHALD